MIQPLLNLYKIFSGRDSQRGLLARQLSARRLCSHSNSITADLPGLKHRGLLDLERAYKSSWY